jgi:hypothetical protein
VCTQPPGLAIAVFTCCLGALQLELLTYSYSSYRLTRASYSYSYSSYRLTCTSYSYSYSSYRLTCSSYSYSSYRLSRASYNYSNSNSCSYSYSSHRLTCSSYSSHRPPSAVTDSQGDLRSSNMQPPSQQMDPGSLQEHVESGKVSQQLAIEQQ